MMNCEGFVTNTGFYGLRVECSIAWGKVVMQSMRSKPPDTRPPDKLEREESQLWRWILLFMILLAAGFAYLAWERLETLPYHLGPAALGVLVLSVLLAVYAYGRRREVTELKTLLHGCRNTWARLRRRSNWIS